MKKKYHQEQTLLKLSLKKKKLPIKKKGKVKNLKKPSGNLLMAGKKNTHQRTQQ